MKIKQLEWVQDEKLNSHCADFMWQYYDKNGKGYGDLLNGYYIHFNLTLKKYCLVYDDEYNIAYGTLDECKKYAQQHFEAFIRSCIDE